MIDLRLDQLFDLWSSRSWSTVTMSKCNYPLPCSPVHNVPNPKDDVAGPTVHG